MNHEYIPLIKYAYVQTKYVLFSYIVKTLYFYQSNKWFIFSLCLGKLVYYKTLFKYIADKNIIVQSQISYEI